jgi:DDE superfamily endonuclease
MPSHLSHILQPLDVGCFGALKTAYGALVADLARKDVFNVDKADFLSMYIKARNNIFKETIIKNTFKNTGLIPFNPEVVTSILIRTPTPPSTSQSNHEPASSPWQSGTPQTQNQIAKQMEIIHTSIQRASQSPTQPIEKMSKSA